jgi:HEAT repeat protein
MHRVIVAFAAALGLWLAQTGGAAAQSPVFLGKGRSEWVKELKAPQPLQRRSAAFALGKLGTFAVQDLGRLRDLMKGDPDAGVRAAAATALGDILLSLDQRETPLYWDQLADALQDVLGNEREDARVRRGAVYALGAFGPAADRAGPALVRALRNPSAPVRQNAAWALGRLGKGPGANYVSELCEALNDADALVRRDAASALGEIGLPGAKAGGASLMELAIREHERGGKGDPVVLKTALGVLVRLAAPELQRGSLALKPLLRDEDPETRRLAAFVLVNIGKPPAEVMVVLREALREDDDEVQELAAAGLAQVGRDAAVAANELAALLDARRPLKVRRNAALALNNIGQDALGRDPIDENAADRARVAIPALLRILQEAEGPDSLEVQQQAARALSNLLRYPKDQDAIGAVRDGIARLRDPQTRQQLVWALRDVQDPKRFGLDQALGRVLEETEDRAVMVRYTAARVLAWNMRDQAPPRTPDVLLQMLRDTRIKIYHGSGAHVQVGDERGMGGMSGIQENVSGDARFMAAEALGHLGRLASGRPDVMQGLREASNDKDPELKNKATEALRRLGAS